MKQPKKLTRAMKKTLSKLGYDPGEWQHRKSADGKFLILINKVTGEQKVLADG